MRASRRWARATVRICLALWFLASVVYTPIHLRLEPHSDDADAWAPVRQSAAVGSVVQQGHDGEDDHGRHPAAQHKFKVTQPKRAPFAGMAAVQPLQRPEVKRDCPQPELIGFSGLSPPELSRRWHFIFRAALPVRAPSLLS